MDACMATLFLVLCHGSRHGADWTPLPVRTGVTGPLSLHVNGADRTLLTVRTGVTGRLSIHVNGADWTPVLFIRQSYIYEAEKEGLWEGGIEGEGKR